MPPSPSAFYRPRDLNDAMLLLKRGATPLQPPVRFAVEPYQKHPTVLDLQDLALAYVHDEAPLLRVGGQTSLQTLVDAPVFRTLASGIVAEGAQLAAGSALRNLATLGGVIANPDAALELRLVLDAIDARYTVQTAEAARTEEFAHDDQLKSDELVLEVEIDQHPHMVGALARVARTPTDAAIAAVAAVMTPTDKGVALRLVVSELDFGFRFDLTPETFDGTRQQILALIEKSARTFSDYRASGAYRRAMASVLAQRALEQAWQKLGTQVNK